MIVDIEETVRDLFDKEIFDIALLGSYSAKDNDLFIANRYGEYNRCFETTSTFLPLLVQLKQHLDCEIIVKHEHRRWILSGKPILHVLFYPSYHHLQIWELPSFIAYLYDRGWFILGDRHYLKQSYERYRSRAMTLSHEVTKYQLIKYCDLAITNILYLSVDSDLFTKGVYTENLLYTIRFVLTELLVTECTAVEAIDFWDWDELLPYLRRRFPDCGVLYRFLLDCQIGDMDLSSAQIKEMFLRCLRLCDRGLSELQYLSRPITEQQ